MSLIFTTKPLGATDDELYLRLHPSIKFAVNALRARSEARHAGFITVRLDLPHKPRTTGEKSQNHHFNGHVQQICAANGWDFDEAKRLCKRKGVPFGYPPPEEVRIKGELFALYKSEADCSTVECAALIEGAHLLAAELGMILEEA